MLSNTGRGCKFFSYKLYKYLAGDERYLKYKEKYNNIPFLRAKKIKNV